MPVLALRIDGLTLVPSHIFVLHVVQVEHSARFADLVVWREVCGIHLPPNNMWYGTEKPNKNRLIKRRSSFIRGSTQIAPYFPRAKHSRVILEANMAVVSGNFTLMSAGYFLSPEARNVPVHLCFFFKFTYIFITDRHQVVRG